MESVSGRSCAFKRSPCKVHCRLTAALNIQWCGVELTATCCISWGDKPWRDLLEMCEKNSENPVALYAGQVMGSVIRKDVESMGVADGSAGIGFVAEQHLVLELKCCHFRGRYAPLRKRWSCQKSSLSPLEYNRVGSRHTSNLSQYHIVLSCVSLWLAGDMRVDWASWWSIRGYIQVQFCWKLWENGLASVFHGHPDRTRVARTGRMLLVTQLAFTS